jgi:hypothetical protein
MIRYVSNKEIDRKRWDECITASQHPLIYAYSWYLDQLCPGRWDALIEEDYSKVFPLPWRKKYGIQYIYTPFFIQQLGLFSKGQTDTDYNFQLLDSIPLHFRLVELNINVRHAVPCKGYKFVTNLNHELDLANSYETLCGNYSGNLVRNLKKAANYGLYAIKDENIEQVIDMFRKEKGREVKHWGDKEYDQLRQLLSECKKRDALEVWGAYSANGEFVSGIIFLRSHGRAIFLFSATGERSRELNAMPWMIDCFIQENSSMDIVLDFEGSNDEGLARFYKSFGAKQTTYQRAVRNKLPAWINFIRKVIK